MDWNKALQPLLKKYRGRKHPLEYKNLYQLLVMVILSAQDSDRHINAVVPDFFKAYPTLKSLSKATDEELYTYLSKVRGFRKKVSWILAIARILKTDKNIPLDMKGLTELPGIGRKTANVIMREMGANPEGVMVDLHVARVAPRLGITDSTDPKKIEADIMAAIHQKDWGEIGMSMSFLGREICRPKNPMHAECPVNQSCAYFHAEKVKGKSKKA